MKRISVIFIVILLLTNIAACSTDEQTSICPNCTATISENSMYCPKCGISISTGLNTETNATTESLDSTTTGTESHETQSTHTHSYSPASCTQPESCACGAVNGSALGHSWSNATCTSAQKCTRCGEINGDALGHNWSNASCTSASKCSRCGESSGSPLGHDWNSATCTTAKNCSRCGKSDGSALGHSWNNATCSAPQTCSRCGTTSGSPLSHSYTPIVTAATCTTQGYTTYTCSCGNSYVSDYVDASHNYQNYKCTSCGTVDKAHAYEYLTAWIKQNGIADGSYTEFEYQSNGYTYKLFYSAYYDYIGVTCNGTSGGASFASLALDTFYYGVNYEDLEMTGYISPSGFTSNTAISYTRYTGPDSTKSAMAEFSRVSVCDLIKWLDWCLATYSVGITIADLGFSSF